MKSLTRGVQTKSLTDSQRPFRVLMTADVVGGVWDYCCVLVAELTAHGHDVTLLAFGEPSAAQRKQAAAARAGLVTAPLKLEWMQGGLDDARRACTVVARLVEELKPTIVHANQFACGSVDVAIPVVVTAHSDVLSWLKWNAPPAPTAGANAQQEPAEAHDPLLRSPRSEALSQIILEQWQEYAALVRDGLLSADAVVAVSRFLADEIRDAYEIDREVSVIYNGWPAGTEAPRPIAERSRLTLLAGRVWDSAKNIQLAVTAAQGWQPGRVLCAGNQRHPESGAAMELGYPVEACGQVPREEMDRYLSEARIYLAPARYEPFGLLPVQAALAGCALLLSDIPSFRELWHGAALFFRSNDPADLRRQWKRLLEDDGLAAGLAALARRRAQEQYSAGRTAAAYAGLYTRLLNANNSHLSATSRQPAESRGPA